MYLTSRETKYLQKSTCKRKKCINVRFGSALWRRVFIINSIKDLPVYEIRNVTKKDDKNRCSLEKKWARVIEDDTCKCETEV